MPNPAAAAGLRLVPEALDRSSFVPLYYQLQEVLKEHIESGVWQPGDAMPSEPELARLLQVSRVVVRQALAILEDDRQIVRIQGRGTFVAQPKIDTRAGGLSRLLASPRSPEVALEVLDVRLAKVEPFIRRQLEAEATEPVLRVTTLFSLRTKPLALTYSFFRRSEAEWLELAAHPGRRLPDDLLLGNYGVQLAHAHVSIETSQCGQFEADRFGIPHRSPVFLVLSTEHRLRGEQTRPFEVARVEYRGDVLQFQLDVAADPAEGMAATWTLREP